MAIILGEERVPRIGDPKIEIPYRTWKIWWWDNEDKLHTIYIKQMELDDVIQFCHFKKIEKYSIFDDRFKNVCNDGNRILMG